MATNKVSSLLGIKYPVIQGGMVWCSGWRLASSVSNNDCLGLIGSGSMDPDLFQYHVSKCKLYTKNPFGVNVTLYSKDVEDKIEIILKEKIDIVFTSAGNPDLFTKRLKEEGVTVVQLVASTKQVLKSINAGVDAIVAEGFEAGGHNGYDETTTMCLIPAVKEITDLPIIAAGGISNGRGMLAAMALGADGVQLGSAFAVSEESSAHPEFKRAMIESKEGDTTLSLKEINPVRMIKNDFYKEVVKAEKQGSSKEELISLLGRGRSQLGIFKGDLQNGELEIGQVISNISTVKPCKEIIETLLKEYELGRSQLSSDEYKYD
ncbi:MAG: nitronate monooxygenase [Flavobacteriales bacterium]|nr:nitronate monooxygenase [Flavobacteriales bacterium]